MKQLLSLATMLLLIQTSSCAQTSPNFTRQDTLRGSNTTGRSWWDVRHYSLSIDVNIEKQEITGQNQMKFRVCDDDADGIMQIDLQEPMELLKAEFMEKSLPLKREGNVYWIDFGDYDFDKGDKDYDLFLYFKGEPRKAQRPPWDGGWIWQADEKGRPWISVACQGLGASAWYACKDYQADEPDEGAEIAVSVPAELKVVANGVSMGKPVQRDKKTVFGWKVVNPINNYNIIPYIGHYTNWNEKFNGENGPLDLSFWVLDYNIDKAKKQFAQDVKPMLQCFENWFGPYPFYEDGFKLVESPHLGMEHQSAIAYGNEFANGYLGDDLSGTGWGLKWDFIVVHEAGHEWFGNNITSKDIADMWVHEGFTAYSETLYTQCRFGNEAGNEYVRGTRERIMNDKPLIGPYGVHQEGSWDMYYKGANLLHTIRQVINNDSIFRKVLRGLNEQFRHSTVSTAEVESFMSKTSGIDLDKIFDQYLRTAKIPVLEYKKNGDALMYRWNNVVDGFDMPVQLLNGKWLRPGTEWKKAGAGTQLKVDPDFYITVKEV